MITIMKSNYNYCKKIIRKYTPDITVIESDMIFIINDREEIKGYIVISKKYDDFYIKSLYVLNQFRGDYLGDGLLRTSLNFLRLQNIKSIKYYGFCEYLKEKEFKIQENNMICNIDNFFDGNKCRGINNEK